MIDRSLIMFSVPVSSLQEDENGEGEGEGRDPRVQRRVVECNIQ